MLLFAVTKTEWRFRNNITVATLMNKVNYSCTENLNEEEKNLTLKLREQFYITISNIKLSKIEI